jgi:long-chain acyl-CoA synthetase
MPSEQESPDPVDVAARLRRTAGERPDHLALIAHDQRITYGELHARVDAATGALQARGVGPGDRVAIVLGTTPTFVEAAAAILRAGAVMVPLLPGLAPDELRFALADAGVGIAIVGPERLEDVAGLRDRLPDLAQVFAAGVPDDAIAALPDGPVPITSWATACTEAAEAGEPARIDRRPDDLAALVYTSGTTGRPRGAMLTRGNLAANQDQSLAGRFQVNADDVILLVLPLAHIYSLNVGLGAAITAGATMVLVERFDPDDCLDAIEEHSVSVVLGAPPMYVAWVGGHALERTDLGSVRLAVSGAAPLPVPVITRFRQLTGITIEEGYGLTEAGPSVCATSMADRPIPGSVGKPLPGVEVRIVDDDEQDVAEGDAGELWVRGPNVFQGFWNDLQASEAALTEDGWLRTGDVAMRDEEGNLYLVDRLKDLVIVNGFNVYPREVERVLLSSGVVAQAAVVGEPHALTGETLVAYVVPFPDVQIDPDDLAERCRTDLARYKCPSRIEVVDHVPTTATGKVRRRLLRDRGPGAAGASSSP